MKKKVSGFILLESILSMVIIVTCFGIALLVFNITAGNSSATLQVRARIALQTEASTCKSQNHLFDEDIVRNEFTMERRVIQDKEHEGLMNLSLRAFTPGGKTIGEYHEFIFSK